MGFELMEIPRSNATQVGVEARSTDSMQNPDRGVSRLYPSQGGGNLACRRKFAFEFLPSGLRAADADSFFDLLVVGDLVGQ
jgi:hypothetical protein